MSGRSSSRVLLAIAAQQSRDTSGAMDTVAPRSSPQALPGSTKITKVWIQTPGPELLRRFDRVQRTYVPLVCRRLLAFLLFWFLGTRRSAWNILSKPEIAITAANCVSFSYLYFCVQQVVRVLIIWNTGFFIWSYFGASRWCYYKLKYCENYASKQWCELHIKLPRYCYVMYNLRKSNLWGTLDFRCSPSRCTAR